jgi:threonine/homoserine/homoserine lactone efflux protein
MGVAASFLAFLDLPMFGRIINFLIGGLMAMFGAYLLLACAYVRRRKRKRAPA